MPLTLVRRAWAAPIAAHLAALFLVLVAGAVFVGTHASLSSDEGAAIVQARQLAEHDTWIRPHPHPELDPEGRNYPYALPERGEKGFAPFAKHPLYALVLAGLWKFGGINALVGLSIVATVAAAAVGSRFGRRIDLALERPAMWGVGVASPLLFDSYLVIAHTIGAAIAGGLVLLLTRRDERYKVAAVLGAAVLAASLVFMRTEGALLVGVAAVVAVLGRRSRWMALAAGGTGIAARLAEQAWTREIVGDPVRLQLRAEEAARERALALSGGGLGGRIEGAWVTLFRPEYTDTAGGALLLASLVGLAASVVLARINPRIATACGAGAAVCAALRVVAIPSGLVPGLFVAAPLVWAGLWAALAAAGDRRLRLDWRLVVVMGGFMLAVLATQYSRGGGVEWGGRFFALVLPVAVPLAVAGLRLQPVAIIRCVSIAAAALSVLALLEVRRIHARTDDLLSALRVPTDAVALTTAPQVPRLDWRRYDEREWLLVPSAAAADLIDRLHNSGVRRVFLLFPAGLRPDGVTGEAESVGDTRWRTVDIVLD